MDRLPYVIKNADDHNILPLITEVFQDIFRAQTYPKDIAANYTKYQVDPDFTDVQATGLTTVKVLQALETRLNDITEIEKEILTNHALAVIQKQNNLPILEELRLKRLELFQKLSHYAVETYDLIQTKDIYPNPIEQYLDFTYNPTLHTCTKPCPPSKKQEASFARSKKCPKVAKTTALPTCPFKAEPEKIVFYNNEPGTPLQEKFKIRNVTQTPQYFSYFNFPKDKEFRLNMLSNTNRVAPGMCAEFVITFHPKVYTNCQEVVTFKTTGVSLSVPIVCMRDPPKLICFIIDQLLPWLNVNKVQSSGKYFSEVRQKALNFSIDCGTCWMGGYMLITMIMKNEGLKGRFFITTENEWLFTQLDESSTRSVELIQGPFTIFPTFFEIEHDEIGQIFILFKPESQGFFTEKLFFLCDNNTHQEVELMGDCIIYTPTTLTVNLYLIEDSFKYSRRLLRINLAPNQKSCFIISINNNSAIHLPYYWALKTNIVDGSKKKMDPDWMDILYNTRILYSLSTTDVVIQITPRTNEEGLYYIYLSFYLKNVPMASITDDEFIVSHGKDFTFTSDCNFECQHTTEEPRYDVLQSYKLADVHIFRLAIHCNVRVPQDDPDVKSESIGASTELNEESLEGPSLTFSGKALVFGVIPKGVKMWKSVTIKNLTGHDMDWTLKELRYCNSHFNIFAQSSHLSRSEGTLKKHSRQKITYTVEAIECLRWASVLILFTCPSCTCQEYILEDACLVAFEVTEAQISIKTNNNTSVLCPKEIIYVGIPSLHTIYVHNGGILTGCFYFLKPTGTDHNKIRVRFKPQSGVIAPGATTPVEVEFVALESGILEDAHVPCFVGDPDTLISLSILCNVFGMNIHFYLPNRGEGYSRTLWPPKTDLPEWGSHLNVDENWSIQYGEGGSPAVSTAPYVDSLTSLIADDSIAATYPTIKTKCVHVKKPTRLTFYFENLTPLNGYYTVCPTNYSPEGDCLNHILVKAKMRTAEFFWEKACLDGYGIVIEPECRSGKIVPYEVIEIHLWIYANTWGKYLEEVIVEIDDITPFCFNLVVDVVGLPIEFPFARNTTLSCPTLRFENIAYATNKVTKSFTVTNISAIPVRINWYIFSTERDGRDGFNIFLDFEEDSPKWTISKTFHGCYICNQCIDISPYCTILDTQSTATVSVTISADGFMPNASTTHIKYKILGFVDLESCHRFKENYFKRNYGPDSTPAKVEVLVTLELPVMQVDLSSDETTIDIFVNDILLTNYKFPQVYLLLRNVDKCLVRFKIDIEKPFEIIEARTVPSAITDQENLVLQRHECLQVVMTCKFTTEELMQYADLIYQRNETQGDITQEFTSVIDRNLNVCREGLSRQAIPFQVRLHFPHMVVKPSFLKFGPCLLYRTKKAMFTIFNMTGSIIRFEIFKTTKLDFFEVHPNHGEIQRSTGLNHQFVDVAVYFTPTQCKKYLASLRILTNFPQYYMNVTLIGHGTNDEKFNTN